MQKNNGPKPCPSQPFLEPERHVPGPQAAGLQLAWPGLPTPGWNQRRGDSGSHSAENRRQVQGTLLPAGLRHREGSQWPPGPPRFTRLSLSQ